MLVHREVARYIAVHIVDCRRQLPRLGYNRSQGSTDHRASSHRMGVGAESEIPMHLTPREGLCQSYRPVHPHETVHKVVARPPCWEALQMEDCGCIPLAVLLQGRPRPSRGAPASRLRLVVVWVASACLLWGVRGLPPWGDCAACWRWAIRPSVVCVAAPGWVPVGAWAGSPRRASAACWASACWVLRFPRLRLRGGSSRSIWGRRVWGAALGS